MSVLNLLIQFVITKTLNQFIDLIKKLLCNRATLLFWKVNFLPRCVDLGFKLKHTCVSRTLCPALSLCLYGRGVNDNSGLLISPLNLLIYH